MTLQEGHGSQALLGKAGCAPFPRGALQFRVSELCRVWVPLDWDSLGGPDALCRTCPPLATPFYPLFGFRVFLPPLPPYQGGHRSASDAASLALIDPSLRFIVGLPCQFSPGKSLGRPLGVSGYVVASQAFLEPSLRFIVGLPCQFGPGKSLGRPLGVYGCVVASHALLDPTLPFIVGLPFQSNRIWMKFGTGHRELRNRLFLIRI